MRNIPSDTQLPFLTLMDNNEDTHRSGRVTVHDAGMSSMKIKKKLKAFAFGIVFSTSYGIHAFELVGQ